jgi:hypothetical protein
MFAPDPVLLMLFFLVKHLVFDFFLQGPFIYLNKGTYGHNGGVLHAALHAASSFVGLWLLFGIDRSVAIQLSFAEGFIHYHMDWFKVWWCKRQNYKPHTDLGCTLSQAHWFWWWVGIDQFVHLVFYLVMVAVIIA